MSEIVLDPESLLNIADVENRSDGENGSNDENGSDSDSENGRRCKDIEGDEILEPEDNISSSQFKLMHFLNAAMLNQKNGQMYMPHMSAHMPHMEPDGNDGNDGNEFKELIERIENISDTNNLIYDETCSITINNEQIKDTIEDLKNKFQSFQIDIENLKLSVDEILVNLRNKINV